MEQIKGFLTKVFERTSGNALRYRLIYLSGAIIHTFFIILFAALNLKLLTAFNILSVFIYCIGSVTIKENKNTALWIVIFYGEIVGHAALCGISLDWSYGFSLYSLMVIPVSYYMTYMDPNIKDPRKFSTILACINVSVMTMSGLLTAYRGYIDNDALAQIVSIFNFVVCAFIIAVFSVIFIYEMHNNMENLRVKNDELNFLANYDALTNLRNRHRISDVFHIYENGTSPFCVILGDIDDFKRINDTYSHDCGDKVLVTISEIIKSNVGSGGVVCRWGGEEILIIVSGKIETTLELAEKIRLIIQNQQISFQRKEIRVTMTFGFADYSEAVGIEKLISIADSRLYYGKKNGKNRVVYKKEQ